MARELSAKDKAFEKVKAGYRQEIRELRREIESLHTEIKSLNSEIAEKDVTIQQQQVKINKLLECENMSEEQLKRLIDRDNLTSEVLNAARLLSKRIYW